MTICNYSHGTTKPMQCFNHKCSKVRSAATQENEFAPLVTVLIQTTNTIF